MSDQMFYAVLTSYFMLAAVTYVLAAIRLNEMTPASKQDEVAAAWTCLLIALFWPLPLITLLAEALYRAVRTLLRY